jgi:cytidylate kinase
MPRKKFTLIAMDGGAASGKSSTAKAISKRFNYLYVDTGSHYRTLTYLMIKKGIIPEDSEAVVKCLNEISLETKVKDRRALVYLNSNHPNESALRTQEVNDQVSRFAAMPALRKFLLNYQRNLASIARIQNFDGMIMEGRDIGSIIFPHADYKFFLIADPDTRIERRALEGHEDAIEQRGRLDSTRHTAPLTCPQGAVKIDTSRLTLEAVIEKISALIEGGKT